MVIERQRAGAEALTRLVSEGPEGGASPPRPPLTPARAPHPGLLTQAESGQIGQPFCLGVM